MVQEMIARNITTSAKRLLGVLTYKIQVNKKYLTDETFLASSFAIAFWISIGVLCALSPVPNLGLEF